jgi:hypothetical protein
MQNNTPEADRLLQEHLASPRGLFKLSPIQRNRV